MAGAAVLMFVMAMQAPAAAQPAQPAAPSSAKAPAAQPVPPPIPEGYSYEPDGRRDPFLNLLGTGGDAHVTGRRGDGPASMTAAEIAVNGVMQSRGSLVALVKGPDGKTYIVHQGDKLADGTIKSVTADGLVILQQVNDPLSLVKQREVRKFLRARGDAKE